MQQPTAQAQQKRLPLALAFYIAIILAAITVRLVGLPALSIWFDEGIAVNAASQTTVLAVISADPTNPPLYYLLLRAAVVLFGDGEFALRWFSIMLGVLVLAHCARFAAYLFGSRAGIYAAVLVALSPPLWWASREVRMYGLLALLLVLAAFAWWRLVNARRHKRWTAFLVVCLAELALLYTHTTGPIAALWLNAVTIMIWFARRNMRRPDWRYWVASQGLVLLLWAPWLLLRFVLVPGANQTVAAPPAMNLALTGTVWQAFWSGAWEMVGNEPTLALASAGLFVLTLIIIPWRQPAARWLMLHALILVVGLVAGLEVVRIGLHGRYLVMIAPLILIAIAGGLGQMRRVYVLAPVILAMPYAGVSGWSMLVAASNPAYAHDSVKAMVKYYATALTAHDTVLAWSYVDRYDLAYYWSRLGVQAQRVTLPEGADLNAIAPLLPQQGGVALNIWYTQRADQRRMLSCVLSNANANPPEEYTVYGMSNQLYPTPPHGLPTWRSVNATFAPADMIAAAQFPQTTAERALCMPVRITTTRNTPRDLKVALIVKNGLGWEIARADAIFARADQKTSTQLAPGATLDAYPLLWLPTGTPPGEYDVVARLYDESELSGYDVLNGRGAATGKDFGLGTLIVSPGANWSTVRRNQALHPANIPASADIKLIGQSMDASGLISATNGSAIQLTMLWQGAGRLPELRLVADDGAWQVSINTTVDRHDPITLDWREVHVPADVRTNTARLLAPNGAVLARYAITAWPGLFDAPPVLALLNRSMAQGGELFGYSLADSSVSRSQPLSVTLVWRGGDTALQTSYTAFVQLIGAGGQVLAQSDAIPGQGQRPTTSWRPGEYIVDQHLLVFHPEAVTGRAKLIAGLYDAATGVRITFNEGADFVQIPVAIDVH